MTFNSYFMSLNELHVYVKQKMYSELNWIVELFKENIYLCLTTILKNISFISTFGTFRLFSTDYKYYLPFKTYKQIFNMHIFAQ